MSDITSAERLARKEKAPRNIIDEALMSDEEYVTNYIQTHPELLDKLVSELHTTKLEETPQNMWVSRQLKTLRERNVTLRKKINELIEIATINEDLLEKTFSMTLSLFETTSLEDFYQGLHSHLREHFKAEAAHMTLFTNTLAPKQPLEHVSITQVDAAKKQVGSLLSYKRVFCGILRENESEFLFPNSDRPLRSSALIPLRFELPEQTSEGAHASGLLAFLAIGSRDPLHFKAKQGHTFLTHLQQVCKLCLTKLMEFDTSAETHML